MKTFVFTLLITPLLWLQRAQSQVGLLQKPGGRRGGRETREGGQHHSDLVGETREESPERGIQPKGRHPGTGPLDVPIQHTPSSFNRHAVVASFQFPLKLSPRSSDSHMLPPHFSFFGFLDTPKTHGEQKGLVACEEVTSTYRYDRRC